VDLTVLALHGLTSTTKVWSNLPAALPGTRIVAPDLAGRGAAAERRTAPGLAGHADDVVRLADDQGLDGVVLVGHSMGEFVAPLVAARLGPRVRKVLLLDGGVAPERSILVSRPVVRALFWTQMRLLDRRWRSPEAFVDAIEGKAIRNRPDLRASLLEWARYLLDGDGRPRSTPAGSSPTRSAPWPVRPRSAHWPRPIIRCT
jgi:pimeloyl-ACP methyl ester carboxylesterase